MSIHDNLATVRTLRGFGIIPYIGEITLPSGYQEGDPFRILATRNLSRAIDLSSRNTTRSFYRIRTSIVIRIIVQVIKNTVRVSINSSDYRRSNLKTIRFEEQPRIIQIISFISYPNFEGIITGV